MSSLSFLHTAFCSSAASKRARTRTLRPSPPNGLSGGNTGTAGGGFRGQKKKQSRHGNRHGGSIFRWQRYGPHLLTDKLHTRTVRCARRGANDMDDCTSTSPSTLVRPRISSARFFLFPCLLTSLGYQPASLPACSARPACFSAPRDHHPGPSPLRAGMVVMVFCRTARDHVCKTDTSELRPTSATKSSYF
ncbi:hypothetical protein F4778DRAFT_286937 [Xylariomycetidae sp. FL2044]|nr:hypothetical protein F4778DRAFT_286937 [Xylariomycetidae sp. FL2044]